MSLELAQDTLYGLGRAYPLSWDTDGTGSHCVLEVDRLTWRVSTSAIAMTAIGAPGSPGSIPDSSAAGGP
ncbi:MAG: hypothetical protein LJE70_07305 [Chromatiaceae bacterium]|nr:hypothetical protein [Chromatiaceae bacterium]